MDHQDDIVNLFRDRFAAVERTLRHQDEKLEAIHQEARLAREEAQRTNGRVTRLELRVDHIQEGHKERDAAGERTKERLLHLFFAVIGAAGAIAVELLSKIH
jgi:hypothetical protein